MEVFFLLFFFAFFFAFFLLGGGGDKPLYPTWHPTCQTWLHQSLPKAQTGMLIPEVGLSRPLTWLWVLYHITTTTEIAQTNQSRH